MVAVSKDTALCLSGGGFRAAAFHLGAVRRLNELGLLAGLSSISAVSGGSLLLLHLANRLSAWFGKARKSEVFGDFELSVAAPFRAFLMRDARTLPIVLGHLDVLRFGRVRSTERLAEHLDRTLGQIRLGELPTAPVFYFNATNLEKGVPFVFSRDRVGDYTVGFRKQHDLPVALAAALSAAYPPVFRPARLEPGGPALADGGIYDNLGLEPVWKRARSLLVSDGGAPLDGTVGNSGVAVLKRTVEVLLHQNGSLRRRMLFGGATRGRQVAYWSLVRARDRSSTALERMARATGDQLLARVRTDLDAFTAGEIAALENHGYLSADVALARYARVAAARRRRPLVLPHPQMVGEAVTRALADSARRRWPWSRVRGTIRT